MQESKTFKFLDFEVRVIDGMIHMYNSNKRFEKEPEKVINLATWADYIERHIIPQCRRLQAEPFLNAAQRDALRELDETAKNAMEIGREAYRQGGAHLMKTATDEAQEELSRIKRDGTRYAEAAKEATNKIILPDSAPVPTEPKKLIIPE